MPVTQDANGLILSVEVDLTVPLFGTGNDHIDFRRVESGTYLPGSRYDAGDGDNSVRLPYLSDEAINSGFDLGHLFQAGNGADIVIGGNVHNQH